MTLSKYAKLNCDIMESRWYRNSSVPVRHCWTCLILHVKAFGLGGYFRPLDTERFAETWHVEEADVLAMIERAVEGNALRCDSDAEEWSLTGWQKHQGDSTGAERQRRYREKTKIEPTDDQKRNDSNGRNALRHGGNAYEKRREEKKGEDISTNVDSLGDEPPQTPKKSTPRFVPPTVEEVEEYMTEQNWPTPSATAQKFHDYWTSAGWRRKAGPVKDWKATVRTWLANEAERAQPQKKSQSQGALDMERRAFERFGRMGKEQ